MGDNDSYRACRWIGAANLMAIGRSQMSKQISNPPQKGKNMPKDACYHKVKARYRVFPSAYASGAIAKCRKVGAANYGTGGKKKKKAKKMEAGGVVAAEMQTRKRKVNKQPKDGMIARGCGSVMERRRKATKLR